MRQVTPMSEKVEEKLRWCSTVWIAFGVAVPVLYVLSVGPVLWVITRLPTGAMMPCVRVYVFFYSPIIWASQHWPWLHSILDPYGAFVVP